MKTLMSPDEKRREYEQLMADVARKIGFSQIFTSDPVECVAVLAKRASIPHDQVKHFLCPCPCGAVHAIYAISPAGAWFSLLSSVVPGAHLTVIRFDGVDDIAKFVAAWPDEDDRMYLAVLMSIGLEDELRELFVA